MGIMQAFVLVNVFFLLAYVRLALSTPGFYTGKSIIFIKGSTDKVACWPVSLK